MIEPQISPVWPPIEETMIEELKLQVETVLANVNVEEAAEAFATLLVKAGCTVWEGALGAFSYMQEAGNPQLEAHASTKFRAKVLELKQTINNQN